MVKYRLISNSSSLKLKTFGVMIFEEVCKYLFAVDKYLLIMQ
jgi:hypothetical protein